MAKSTPGRRMNAKLDFLRDVDAYVRALIEGEELNPIPETRSPLHIRQDQVGGASYLSPIVGPCCHPAEESTTWTDDASTIRGRMGQ
jgi:hypothetical protein